MIIYDDSLKSYTSTLLPKRFLLHGFGTKALSGFPQHIPHKLWISMNQVHETHIQHINTLPDNVGTLQLDQSDGVSTFLRDVLLTVKTGDCIAALYYDRKTQLIAISHQGWKGVLAHMSEKMIEHMRNLGSDPSDINVIMGPSIGHCCNRFSKPELRLFMEEFPADADRIITPYSEGKHLDTRTLTYLQCIKAGIQENNFDTFSCCTKCMSDTFWSHRGGTYQSTDVNRVGWNFIMKIS